MAGTAVLERTLGLSPVWSPLSSAEAEHNRNIADNIKKLRLDNAETSLPAESKADTSVSASSVYPAFVGTEEPETERMGADAAARMSQYRTVEAPRRHELFEGVTLKDGVLQGVEPMYRTAEPAAPVAEIQDTEEENEDALPTRRTLDTLTRPATVAAVETAKPHFFAALSVKTKVALAVVVAVVVVALLLIGINTSIINSMSAQITAKETELQGLIRATEQVEGQIADMTTPENVARWAEENGMTLGR